MAKWLEEIRDALNGLGGTASLEEIYQQVLLTTGDADLPKPSLRRVIYQHSSDAPDTTFIGGSENDIFYTVEGKGKGIWGLRKQSKNWDREELDASVKAYQRMLQLEASGENFVKKRIYERLSEKFGRSASAYERRMSNISYIYSNLGRRTVTGLKPLSNVGVNVIALLEELIQENESKPDELRVAFQEEVKKFQKKGASLKPAGVKKPKQIKTASTAYERDPEIVAWLLNNSNGICECCEKAAPFTKNDGSFYLEVHHLQRLADGGSDTVCNAIAACPNCHRELHYGDRREDLLKGLYLKIERLFSK